MSQCFSQDSSQGTEDLSSTKPTEELYQQVLSVSTASAGHCLTFTILLRHLVSSYMTVNESSSLKAFAREPGRSCPLLTKDCVKEGRSHVACFCSQLAGKLGRVAEDFMEDFRVIRKWRHHHANLKDHLERISSDRSCSGIKMQAHLLTLFHLGSVG